MEIQEDLKASLDASNDEELEPTGTQGSVRKKYHGGTFGMLDEAFEGMENENNNDFAEEPEAHKPSPNYDRNIMIFSIDNS